MVIEILSDSELSDAIVISGFLIKEEIWSAEIQQLEQQPELDPMVKTRKQLALATDPAKIPIPGLHHESNLV